MDTIEKALKKHQSEADSQPLNEASDNGELSAEHADNEAFVEPERQLENEQVEQFEKAPIEPEPLDQIIQEQSAGGRIHGQVADLELDFDVLGKMGIIMPDDKRSQLKEEYKHIKRPLLQKAALEGNQLTHSNLIMVTSAHSGEGKTFSSLNLAMSIAVERDRRVLLIDADVVKPSLDGMLNVKGRPGLVDYLNGELSDFADAMIKTNVDNLTVVPAGRAHHLTHELLASNAMRDLANEMASRYPDRIIILDSPPVLATSEAKVLSRLVGQIVLVVEQDKTSQTAVKDAIEYLEKDKITGLILNKSKTASETYYGYYYGENK